MKRPVRWSQDALDDIDRQLDYLGFEDADAAYRIIARIEEIAGNLGHFAIGHPGRVTGTYEKLVSHLPYVIAYEIVNTDGREAISVLRIIHTSRNWPDEEWPS